MWRRWGGYFNSKQAQKAISELKRKDRTATDFKVTREGSQYVVWRDVPEGKL
jgi:hypothetical protein